jgi:hypothetical protein
MKQMGHSSAFLYKKASTRCPLTYGSFGRVSSCGAISVCEALREPVASEASVFARPRKNGDDDELVAIGDVGDGRENAGCDGDRLLERSEFWDMLRDPIGTVRLLRFGSELRGFHAGLRCLLGRDGSSGGMSSAAGSGRPLTTATSWCSVQVSSWSSSPFQKGASRRSIYQV